MNNLSKLYRWARELWPLQYFPLLIVFHLLLLRLFPQQHVKIDLLCSAGFQVIGGVLVLYSINSNMFLLSNTTIKQAILNWVKRFPLFRKTKVVGSGSAVQAHSSCSAVGIVMPPTNTIEEKVEYLLQEVINLHSKINQAKTDLQKDIKGVEANLELKHSELQNEVKEIKLTIQNVIVGGAKIEVLGIATISYGLFIPIL